MTEMGRLLKDCGVRSVYRCMPARSRRAGVWRVLNQDDIDWFDQNAVCKGYTPDEMVFSQGDACDGIYLICKGMAAVRKSSSEGKSVLMKLARPGDMLGYRPFLAGEPHRARAQFVKPGGRVCFLKSSVVRELLMRQPLFGLELLKCVSKELGEAEERFSHSVTKVLRNRFGHWLLLMKEPYGTSLDDGGLVLELPISRAEIAEMLGVRAESLSRAIHQMTEDGVVRFTGRKAWIDEPDRLIEELS